MINNSEDVISILNKEIVIKGSPIKDTEMFKILSDMNVSDQYINDYSNSLHRLLKARGREEAEEKILAVFRINPLAAVRIIESCSIIEDMDKLAYSIKPIFDSIMHNYESFPGMVLNINRVPYVTLLIEAVFQQSMEESYQWDPNRFLEYALEEDSKLYKRGIKAKYCNAYNIRHILRHIPENRQIEFINWFWDRHCYAAAKFGKAETFAGTRVRIMMDELVEGSLWNHLENSCGLSQREKNRQEKESDEIKHFISEVIYEGRHLQYISRILGKDHFYDKLKALVGDDYCKQYDLAVEKQKQIEASEGTMPID